MIQQAILSIRLIIFIGLLMFLLRCKDEYLVSIPNSAVTCEISYHNGLQERFVNVPLTFSFNVTPPRVVNTAFWSFGDQSSSSKFSAFHTYSDAGDFNVSLTLTSPNFDIARDTLLHVVKGPLVYGVQGVTENSEIIFQDSLGNFGLIYASTDYNNFDTQFMLPMGSKLELQGPPVPLDIYSYAIPGSWMPVGDGTIAWSVGQALITYTSSGVPSWGFQLDYYRVIRDIASLGQELAVISDSTQCAVIDRINVTTQQDIHKVYPLGNEKILEGLFLGDSNFISVMRDPNQFGAFELKNFGFDGTVQFTTSNSSITDPNNITQTASGWYITSNPMAGQLSIIKLDFQGALQWKKTFNFNNPRSLGFPHGPRAAVRERAGYIYLFFDNMRCIKMAAENGVISSDVFYDLQSSIFGDVTETREGTFLMVGSRQFDAAAQAYTFDQSVRDLVIVEINAEGLRVTR